MKIATCEDWADKLTKDLFALQKFHTNLVRAGALSPEDDKYANLSPEDDIYSDEDERKAEKEDEETERGSHTHPV